MNHESHAGTARERAALDALRPRLEETCTRDAGRLRRRWRQLRAQQAPVAEALAALRRDIEASCARRAARAAALPTVAVDPALPLAAHADAIIAALRAHQVLVVAGETGSGKTTQLPKLCLAAGRGAAGLIGCTQPRRLAARSVARRVAAELGTEVGAGVGCEVRFDRRVSDATLVKFMTDGILLAELQRDRWLSAYDTLIIDEAHERSLNIDFLLGYLKQLLRRRRDLKLIVTSATIDTARFAAHFGDAPVIEVPGRAWPVALRWRDLDAFGARAEGVHAGSAEHVALALEEISAEDPRGDVLVFLPGEREIRDTHRLLARRRWRDTEILPLYARLPAREQDRVFHPGRARRIVLATNVAETSLTVPRIRWVVDTGLARVKRYSRRRQIEQLRVEPVSRAAADQRAGRCGRTGPGICLRLWAEAEHASRPRWTDPELLRSSLAGVILRMLDIGLGKVAEFPFLDAPEPAAIADGERRLDELGAVDARGRLSRIGREMARLPIDAQLARILVAAREKGVLAEVLPLVAFLGVQDPRERPPEARAQADAAHAAFADPRSDFSGIARLWQAWSEAHAALTQRRLRAWCTRNFLSWPRMREWRELHRQLRLQPGFTPGAEAPPPAAVARPRRGRKRRAASAEDSRYERIHRALLAGLPTQVGRRDEDGVFHGPRQRRFRVFPGSALAKKPPRWLLAGQILDLGPQVWGLLCARVEPRWIEAEAAHLLRHAAGEPWWEPRRGAVVTDEQISLFGLVLVPRRIVPWRGSDPAPAHAVFLREALAECALEGRADFLAANRAVLAEAREMEVRARRHDLVRDVDERAAFFAGKLPPEITSRAALAAWWRRAGAAAQATMRWTLADVLRPGSGHAPGDFPATLDVGGRALALAYRFLPGEADDGVTLVVPLPLLAVVPAARCEWLVPGLLRDKVVALLRGLPKKLRRNFVPAPDFARAFQEAEPPRDTPLAEVLAAFLHRATGVEVTAAALVAGSMPAHLRMRFELRDDRGEVLAAGRDLDALRRAWGGRAQDAFAQRLEHAAPDAPATRWAFGALPEQLETADGLPAWLGLEDLGAAVAVRAFATAAEARAAHPAGVRRLLELGLSGAIRRAQRQLPIDTATALQTLPLGGDVALRADLVAGAFADLLAGEDLQGIRDAAACAALEERIRGALFAAASKRLEPLRIVIARQAALRPLLEPPLMGFAAASYDDLHTQLELLLAPHFARDLPLARLRELPRYLEAMRLRAERLRQDPARDRRRLLELDRWWRAWHRLAAGGRGGAELEQLRWLIEEYRVSLFAQELGTAEKVSPRRLARQLERAEAEAAAKPA